MALNGTGCFDWQSAGHLKTEQTGCVTPQASLVVKDEACWPNKAEESLSCCQVFFIHLVSVDSEHMIPSLQSHQSHKQHFAAQTLTLTTDKPLTSAASSFIFCAISIVPLCQSSSQNQGLTHPAQVPSPNAHLLSIFVYGRIQWCSHKAEVLSSHTMLTSFFYHHRPDSSVATPSFHKNMGVSNGPKHLELQGIKRYSVSVRPATLSHLTYPSARQKLSCRLDPVCGLQVGWSLMLCSSNTAVPVTQHLGEEKVEGEVRLFGEARNLWPFISCTAGGWITHFII